MSEELSEEQKLAVEKEILAQWRKAREPQPLQQEPGESTTAFVRRKLGLPARKEGGET